MRLGPGAEPHGAAPLVPGSVFAIGGMLPANRPTSWIVPQPDGLISVNCYVLRSQGSVLIIDTGLAVHWEQLRRELDALLDGARHPALIMTRREPDAIGNLPALVARYALRSVYCGGVISPLDFFERVDQASAASHIRSVASSDAEWLQPGATVPVGDLCLEVLRTTLRVLPKNHLYERTTRSLFASDTWGMLPQRDAGPVGVVRTVDDGLLLPAVVRYLRHRFEWLAGIDTGPMQRELAELLETRPIDRICSSYGCVIEGREVVAAVLRTTIQALRILSHEPRVRRMDRLDQDRITLAVA